jgi:predicted unusual protein kinase regulating ubiquinone biosynthesis (AarF/ABC1/UbiB family)
MIEQDAMESSRFSRSAALVGSGARVGINYLKYYARRALSGEANESSLHEENADEIYKTFRRLKGGPLKLAQMLSIDKNLLPPAYARQFGQGQYSAPPLSYPLVVRTFRREFACEPSAMFESFSRQAEHGASIGQVHRASKDGREFAVKVQYPGVADSLRNDLRLIKPIALQVLGLRQQDVEDYFREVEARLLEETDYALELRRSIELSCSSSHLENVSFPTYYPELSSSRVLTMGWVAGIPLDRYADSDSSPAERDQIGQALWDFYSHQIHSLRAFHADPHPGNFLVKDRKLWVLDFGCTKTITEDFHRKQFAFLDPSVLADRARLEKAMEDLDILLPGDGPAEREKMIALCERSIELLSRPFRERNFDFGKPELMTAIYEMGEENRKDETLRSLRGRRGSADSIYVNRTFFGLYSLLSRLRARIRVSLPAVPPFRQPVSPSCCTAAWANRAETAKESQASPAKCCSK